MQPTLLYLFVRIVLSSIVWVLSLLFLYIYELQIQTSIRWKTIKPNAVEKDHLKGKELN